MRLAWVIWRLQWSPVELHLNTWLSFNTFTLFCAFGHKCMSAFTENWQNVLFSEGCACQHWHNVPFVVNLLLVCVSFYHNWSATKQRPHPQSVAEISRRSVLSGDRILWWMNGMCSLRGCEPVCWTCGCLLIVALVHSRSVRFNKVLEVRQMSGDSCDLLSVQCYAWTEYKFTCVCLCVCPSHFLSTRLQVRPLNRFLQLIA